MKQSLSQAKCFIIHTPCIPWYITGTLEAGVILVVAGMTLIIGELISRYQKFAVVLYMGVDFNQFSRDLTMKKVQFTNMVCPQATIICIFASVLNQTQIQN